MKYKKVIDIKKGYCSVGGGHFGRIMKRLSSPEDSKPAWIN